MTAENYEGNDEGPTEPHVGDYPFWAWALLHYLDLYRYLSGKFVCFLIVLATPFFFTFLIVAIPLGLSRPRVESWLHLLVEHLDQWSDRMDEDIRQIEDRFDRNKADTDQ